MLKNNKLDLVFKETKNKLYELSVINYQTLYRFNLTNSLVSKKDHHDNVSYVPDRLPSVSGWYMLEMKVTGGAQVICGSLSFKFSGSSKSISHKLVFTNNKILKRVIFLKKNTDQLLVSFDVGDSEVEVKEFELIKVSYRFAKDRMSRKLGLSEPTQSMKYLWRSYLRFFESYYNSSYLLSIESSYQNWILLVESKQNPTLATMRSAIDAWVDKPTISLIMPAYNTPEKYLRECIESVLSQSYEYWELCITDDASTSTLVKDVLDSYSKHDSRIKCIYRTNNGHISRASNDAINIASGDFIAFLDHDDMLAKDSLYHLVSAIQGNPEAKLLYSDEDWVDEKGKRIAPHFKSDWNQDLFFSHNYITHLAVYKSSLIHQVGGLRPEVDGSQDYDLILRCLPHLKQEEIYHIPKILYHWRAIEGSTAYDAGEKSYTVAAGKAALENYFKMISREEITVEPLELDNSYKINWPTVDPLPRVTLIIPTRDMLSVLKLAVSSILDKTEYENFNILIVDNDSAEKETLDYFNEITKLSDKVRVLQFSGDFNFSAINNFAVENTDSEIVGLINNDIEVINSEWLTEMVSHAVREDIGCVGAKLYYPNDTVQHAGIIMGLGGAAAHSHRHFPREHPGYIGRLKMVQNLSGVTAACLLVKKVVYQEVGGLDEINLKVAYNDVDFCLKVREAGYRNLWTPFAEAYHHESVSRGYEDTIEKQKRFKNETHFIQKKWGDLLAKDPYYNPNLTHAKEDFSINLDPKSCGV